DKGNSKGNNKKTQGGCSPTSNDQQQKDMTPWEEMAVAKPSLLNVRAATTSEVLQVKEYNKEFADARPYMDEDGRKSFIKKIAEGIRILKQQL
ncbi:unnamed protein product, partial [Prorocentrum cordatum]